MSLLGNTRKDARMGLGTTRELWTAKYVLCWCLLSFRKMATVLVTCAFCSCCYVFVCYFACFVKYQFVVYIAFYFFCPELLVNCCVSLKRGNGPFVFHEASRRCQHRSRQPKLLVVNRFWTWKVPSFQTMKKMSLLHKKRGKKRHQFWTTRTSTPFRYFCLFRLQRCLFPWNGRVGDWSQFGLDVHEDTVGLSILMFSSAIGHAHCNSHHPMKPKMWTLAVNPKWVVELSNRCLSTFWSQFQYLFPPASNSQLPLSGLPEPSKEVEKARINFTAVFSALFWWSAWKRIHQVLFYRNSVFKYLPELYGSVSLMWKLHAMGPSREKSAYNVRGSDGKGLK